MEGSSEVTLRVARVDSAQSRVPRHEDCRGGRPRPLEALMNLAVFIHGFGTVRAVVCRAPLEKEWPPAGNDVQSGGTEQLTVRLKIRNPPQRPSRSWEAREWLSRVKKREGRRYEVDRESRRGNASDRGQRADRIAQVPQKAPTKTKSNSPMSPGARSYTESSRQCTFDPSASWAISKHRSRESICICHRWFWRSISRPVQALGAQVDSHNLSAPRRSISNAQKPSAVATSRHRRPFSDVGNGTRAS